MAKSVLFSFKMSFVVPLLGLVALVPLAWTMQKVSERRISNDPPLMSTEEARSRFIPPQYACDACRVVAFQVS